MKVSVVIPVFNEEKYIGKCLKSLSDQEIKPDEIIIVDNLSSDNSVSIIKTFGVTLIQERTQGISQARNKGFDMANYEIIARCDADSILPPNWIKKIKYNFESAKIDGLLGPIIYYDLPLQSLLFSKAFIYLMRFIQGYHTIFGNNMAISKAIWKKVREKVCLDNTAVHEDIDLAIHIHIHGGIIKYDPNFTAQTSGRRIKNNPLSFFMEYPIRLIRTLKIHSRIT